MPGAGAVTGAAIRIFCCPTLLVTEKIKEVIKEKIKEVVKENIKEVIKENIKEVIKEKIKEVIKEQPRARNLLAMVKRLLQSTNVPNPRPAF